MRLLLDQGLPRSAATQLSEAGINTIHVAEIGLSAADDQDILQKAKDDNRVVITLDADFHALLALSGADSPSVIRIRIERLRAQELTNLLLTVISEFVEYLEQGVVITVEASRVRMRHLPLVLCQGNYDRLGVGSSRSSFTRASTAENCQSTVAC